MKFTIAATALLAAATVSAVAVAEPEPHRGGGCWWQWWGCGPKPRDVGVLDLATRSAAASPHSGCWWNWWGCGPKPKRDAETVELARRYAVADPHSGCWWGQSWGCGPKAKRDGETPPAEPVKPTAEDFETKFPFSSYPAEAYLYDMFGGPVQPAGSKRSAEAEPECSALGLCDL